MNPVGKRTAAIAVVISVVTLAAAVAGATGGRGPGAVGRRDPSLPAKLHTSSFAWLQPSVAPADWSVSRLPRSPARLPEPGGWRREDGDAGTRTAVLRTRSGQIAGYLNATPRQGVESLRNWAAFRVAHNREEGDREVRLLAGATGLRFRSATGSCVLDSYRTESGHRYREVACIVAGRSATTVIVGAAPPHRWNAEAPTIQQAIDSFTT
jgi:hypothetical protein